MLNEQDLILKCSAWKGFINFMSKKNLNKNFGSKKNFGPEKNVGSEKKMYAEFFLGLKETLGAKFFFASCSSSDIGPSGP